MKRPTPTLIGRVGLIAITTTMMTSIISEGVAGIVLAPDGTSVARDVSLDFGKPAGTHWLLTYDRIPPPRPVPGTAAVIATALAQARAAGRSG